MFVTVDRSVVPFFGREVSCVSPLTVVVVTVDRVYCIGPSPFPFCMREVPCLLPLSAFIILGRLPAVLLHSEVDVFVTVDHLL